MSKKIDENWKYNVSKKIAQLTRVVFRLHTESIDRRDAIARMKKNCDQEIALVVEKSNKIIDTIFRYEFSTISYITLHHFF